MNRRPAAFLAIGLVAGLIMGYALRGRLASPLGSRVAERRILTTDVDLGAEYYFAPEAPPPVTGKLGAGTRLSVEWVKARAAYVSFATVVDMDALERFSVPEPAE